MAVNRARVEKFARAAWPLLLLGGLSISLIAHADIADSPVGLRNDVVFTDYSPLSRSEALVERLLTPLMVAQMRRQAARSGLRLREQPVDLAQERFALFIPARPPPPGYALLVFISPLEGAMVPPEWIPVLDRHGVIFVSAANSGNPEDVMERRVPLALLAAHNVMGRYPVDKARVYIGGMSGGSRVALRMALAYPDLFHGALLHSGSDRIAGTETPLPSQELFRQFQESTRLVFLTGQNDRPNRDADEESRASLQEWCVFDIDVQVVPFASHELAGGHDFEPALAALGAHVPSKPNKLDACRAHKALGLTAKLQAVQESLKRGKREEAAALLKKIDTHYAGLAAPSSTELAEKIDPGP
jgi:pimeloyl-ACP methyl ester carboxylesterase